MVLKSSFKNKEHIQKKKHGSYFEIKDRISSCSNCLIVSFSPILMSMFPFSLSFV